MFVKCLIMFLILLVTQVHAQRGAEGRAARRNATNGYTATASQGGATTTRSNGGAVSRSREVRGRLPRRS